MNSRKTFAFVCSISLILVLVAIITIIIVSLTSSKNVTTEKVIPSDYPERLIQGVKDGDLIAVADLLALTNEYMNLEPNENE